MRTVELRARADRATARSSCSARSSASKITGEEERYSHIDLVDFEANVEGARGRVRRGQPLLDAPRPALVGEIDTRFAAVDGGARRRTASGGGFVPYTDADERDTRALSQAIDALAEPLSQVAALVVAGQ